MNKRMEIPQAPADGTPKYSGGWFGKFGSFSNWQQKLCGLETSAVVEGFVKMNFRPLFPCEGCRLEKMTTDGARTQVNFLWDAQCKLTQVKRCRGQGRDGREKSNVASIKKTPCSGEAKNACEGSAGVYEIDKGARCALESARAKSLAGRRNLIKLGVLKPGGRQYSLTQPQGLLADAFQSHCAANHE